MTRITGATLVAGVVGHPVAHSLSPLIHNAWIEAAGLDAVYVAFSPPADRFAAFAEGLRGGVVRGLNVTLPFKEAALACADKVSDRARLAEAANLLLFEADGTIVADNVDGLGMLGALTAQAPGFDPTSGPAVVLGAGGAARGAVAALMAAGAPEVRIANRTLIRAEAIAEALNAEKGANVTVWPLGRMEQAFSGAAVVINATSAGLSGVGELDAPLQATPGTCVVMDMVYKPLLTPFLARGRALDRPTVDGLEMLVRQAAPSFEAFFGRAPDPAVDVRTLALKTLEGLAT